MTSAPRPRRYYFPIRTQFENLGDIEICVAVLELLRANGTVRVDGSAVPAVLHEALRLAPDELVTGRQWYAGMLGLSRGSRRSRRVLVLKPGGLVNPRNRREQLGFLSRLGLVAGARASGAAAVQCCWSCGDLRPPWARLERWKARLLDVARPRDVASVRLLGLDVEPVADAAILSPDIASPGDRPRHRLVVSLRDHDGLTIADAEPVGRALRRLATEAALTPTVVVQVGRDDELCRAVADAAGTSISHRWDPQQPSSRHGVFDAYREAAVVVSNRLHVLLIARLLGASVVAVADRPTSKAVGALTASAIGHAVVSVDELRAGPGATILVAHPVTDAELLARDRLRATLNAALATA